MLSSGLNIRPKGKLIKFPIEEDTTLAKFTIFLLLISTLNVLWSAIRLCFQMVLNNVNEVECI